MVVVICAWCRDKMKIQDTWQVVTQSAILDKMADETITISHGVCPECCDNMEQAALQAAKKPLSDMPIGP